MIGNEQARGGKYPTQIIVKGERSAYKKKRGDEMCRWEKGGME